MHSRSAHDSQRTSEPAAMSAWRLRS